jgi:hypothetical protein
MLMQKILQALKREGLEIIPPAIFFFVAFNVLTYTKRLMLEEYGIEFSGFVTATLGAVVVAKVVLLADHIRFINRYPDRPLIYNVAWKTVIYVLVTLVVRFLEYLLPHWWHYRSLSAALEHMWNETIWPHFWAIQLWLICLFFVYLSAREFARAVGEDTFFKMFLGIQRDKTGAGRNNSGAGRAGLT